MSQKQRGGAVGKEIFCLQRTVVHQLALFSETLILTVLSLRTMYKLIFRSVGWGSERWSIFIFRVSLPRPDIQSYSSVFGPFFYMFSPPFSAFFRLSLSFFAFFRLYPPFPPFSAFLRLSSPFYAFLRLFPPFSALLSLFAPFSAFLRLLHLSPSFSVFSAFRCLPPPFSAFLCLFSVFLPLFTD